MNASVDYQNDQITLQQTVYAIENAQRDLNLVMGRNVDSPIKVTSIEISPFVLSPEKMLAASYEKNTNYLQVVENIKLAKNQIRLETANWMPRISLTTSYSWSNNFRGAAGFFASQFTQGFNFGLQVNWNVFDGEEGLTQIKTPRSIIKTRASGEKSERKSKKCTAQCL